MTSLYTPYKAVGYVTDGNAFVINKLGDEVFLTSSIGNAFQVFRFNKLHSCLVSRVLSSPIDCFECVGQDTFVVTGKVITVFHRTKPVRKYEVHNASIAGLCRVGNFLISYDVENTVKMIDVHSRSITTELQFIPSTPNATISCIIHPSTYINKFLVGFSDGELELWNFNSRSIVYKFKAHIAYLQKRYQVMVQQDNDDDDDDESALNIVQALRAKNERKSQGYEVPGITCIEQSPSADVVCVGFTSGDILLLNLKFDIVLFGYKQDSAVTSLSFRTDISSQQFPCLASGCADGYVHIWCLGVKENTVDDDSDDESDRLNRKLHCSLESAHTKAISRVYFMPGEPILVTASADNSIKVWMFDSPDGVPRLLRSREGHSAYPMRIRYYGGVTNVSMRDNSDATSCEILSAGTDGTFRVLNTAIEAQNKELTQKPILKKLGYVKRNQKLPLIIGFDFCETRHRDWGDIVSIHANHSFAYIWQFKNRSISELVLKQPEWNEQDNRELFANYANKCNHAVACCISPCGNFALIGTKGGNVFKYNMQSGLPRGSYPSSSGIEKGYLKDTVVNMRTNVPGNVLHEVAKVKQEEVITKDKRNAASCAVSATPMIHHTDAVSGLFVDIACSLLISCSIDGSVIFWDFRSHKPVHIVRSNESGGSVVPCLLMEGYREGGLVAVASQDRVVRLYDCSNYTLCRRFDGRLTRDISDMVFSPDGRRIIISSLDSTIRVWDIPTGRCVSWMRFDAPVISMAMSLSGEYLSISQVDKEGVFIYVDRSLYSTVYLGEEPKEPVVVSSCEVKSGDEDEEIIDNVGSDSEEEIMKPSQPQIIEETAGKIRKRESTDQREEGCITLSSVPRAYWDTLFHLEVIKARNRPTEAAAAAPIAPFFLPTVFSNSSAAPSFPTPQEFAKLSKKMKPTEPVSNDDAIANELAGMGSVWTDADGEQEDDEIQFTVDTNTADASSTVNPKNNSTSRLLSKIDISAPRCQLAFKISEECKGSDSNSTLVLDYLMTIPPSAIDAELRSLCTRDNDEEGLELLHNLIESFTRSLSTGSHFEVLQAYIYRFLMVYSETILKSYRLSGGVNKLKTVHALYAEKFRHMVQGNLCLLKLLSDLPTM